MKRILFSVAIIAIILSLVLIQKMNITGYIVLPANVQEQESVIEYVKQTQEFKDFKAISVVEPKLEKIYLCSYPYNAEVCKIIENKMEKFGWERTYYWYLKFSGKRWLGREASAEFLVKGNDGVIVYSHIK